MYIILYYRIKILRYQDRYFTVLCFQRRSLETARMYQLLIGFLALLPLTSGLYFHIGETERKCFIEEIPDETMVTGNYKVQLYDPRTNGFAASSPEIGRTEHISL